MKATSKIRIRAFRFSDLSYVTLLMRDSFPWLKLYGFLIMLGFGKIWDRVYWAIRTLSLHPLFTNDYERCHFVAEIEGSERVVGFVSSKYKARYLLDTWGLHMLCVDPNYRRLGIGTMLTKRIISFAKHKKAKFLFLSVRRDNLAAVNLYQKMGFRFDGGKSQLVYMFLGFDCVDSCK